MMIALQKLLPHEFSALLEALRRDVRSESSLSQGCSEWTDWHRANARMSMRLLEALNPKSIAVGMNGDCHERASVLNAAPKFAKPVTLRCVNNEKHHETCLCQVPVAVEST